MLSMKGLETVFCVYEWEGKSRSDRQFVELAEHTKHAEYDEVLNAHIERALKTKPGIDLKYAVLSLPGNGLEA